MERTVTHCDFCGNPAACVQKQIDGKEFDLCGACWSSLADKISGKGRLRAGLEPQGNAQESEEYDEISIY